MSKTQHRFTVETDQELFLMSLKRHRVSIPAFIRYLLTHAEREMESAGGYWEWFADKEHELRERKEV